jgi:hypothetical protein
LFKKRYWVYELDTFMVGFLDEDKPDITPKKKFLFKTMAIIYRNRIQKKMSILGEYLAYYVLEAKSDESFQEAYKRENGGM